MRDLQVDLLLEGLDNNMDQGLILSQMVFHQLGFEPETYWAQDPCFTFESFHLNYLHVATELSLS